MKINKEIEEYVNNIFLKKSNRIQTEILIVIIISLTIGIIKLITRTIFKKNVT